MSERAFPIITVPDLAATRRFYEMLGFTHTYQFPPDGERGFVTLERGSSSIGIGGNDPSAEDTFGYWVYVDDVDASSTSLPRCDRSASRANAACSTVAAAAAVVTITAVHRTTRALRQPRS